MWAGATPPRHLDILSTHLQTLLTISIIYQSMLWPQYLIGSHNVCICIKSSTDTLRVPWSVHLIVALNNVSVKLSGIFKHGWVKSFSTTYQ